MSRTPGPRGGSTPSRRIPTLLLLVGFAAHRASAAPTVEEEALRASLDRRTAEAVRLLDRDGDPQLRWVAGRVALGAGDTITAARLFEAPDIGNVWDRVDVAARRGDAPGAARLALAEMDRALGGVHRDALGRLLVGWAGERVVRDESNAARFLLAVLGLTPSAEVRRAAEDQLFRLAPDVGGDEGLLAAQRRLLEEPGSVPARYRVAIGLAGSRPLTAATWLADLVREAPHDDAVASARRLVGLAAPDPLVVDALAALGERFPEDVEVARLRLEHAQGVAARDEAAGTAVLAQLARVAPVATNALEAWARATSEPSARRGVWLELAEREGASARGDEARREAYQSLLETAAAIPTPEARRAFAIDALRLPDGAGTPELLYLGLPDGAGRTDALWSHAERFPTGPWCTELAERLVETGATADVAQRFATTCPAAVTGGGDAPRILGFAAISETALVLQPRPGGIDVLSANARTLRVSEHHVDAEALFRATTGDPLDQPLDAFLLDPDATWEVRVPDGVVRPIRVQPRTSGLVTLTVRADDQRATALVVTDPLEVQVVRREDDVAVAVLRAGGGVAGAELLVQDAAGGMRTARTDGRGIVVLHGLPTTLRIMARKGRALGFSVAAEDNGTLDTVATAWDVVLWDRAVPEPGAYADVQVYATRPAGSPSTVPGGARLRSLDRRGAPLDEVSVAEGMFVDGAAHVRLFVQGGGSLSLETEEGEVCTRAVSAPPEGSRDLRIRWEPAAPIAGQAVVATLAPAGPIGPGGIAGEVTVTTPWSTVTRSIVLTAEGVRLPVDLAVAAPHDRLEVTFRSTSGAAVGSGLTVGAGDGPGPVQVPTVVGVGVVVPVDAPAGSWVQATSVEGGQRWRRAGEPLTLPRAGIWQVAACTESCGPSSSVLVADGEIDGEGRWTGAPALAALTAEDLRSARIVRAGDTLGGPAAPGAREAWTVVTGAGHAVPVRGAEPPAIGVTGSLQRGAPSTLDIGADLPAGSKVWAFLRDASESPPLPSVVRVAGLWEGAPGIAAVPWSPTVIWGEGIAAALLEEEERLAEARDVKRVDFNFGADVEIAEAMGTSGSGYGSGGGGYASDTGYGHGGLGRVGYSAGPRGLAGDPVAIGVYTGVAPGPLNWRVPAWVVAADLQVVARTPDGRWASRVVRLDVGGGGMEALPVSPPTPPPEIWDGALASLVPLARSLPSDARIHALSALAQAGVPEALVASRAAWALDPTPDGAGAALARRIPAGDTPPPGGWAARQLDGLSDLRRAERAEAALAIAGIDPDRAKAIAGRLIKDADVADPGAAAWVRTRAGLALWVAGAPSDALAALLGDDPGVAAARAVVSGRGEPAFATAWWTLARNEGANPADRALALHALTLLPGRPPITAAPPGAPGVVNLPVAIEPALAQWRGEVYTRGGLGDLPAPALTAERVPVGRVVPVRVQVPSAPVPTRVACPDGSMEPWVDLAPTLGAASVVWCRVRFSAEAPQARVEVRWVGPDGAVWGVGSAQTVVEAARESGPTDPMSPRERLGLGLRLGASGDAGGLGLLEDLLTTADLPPGDIQAVASALLVGRRLAGSPDGLIQAFSAYREHVPDGDLDLATAAALAHAYDQEGDPARAVAAARVVMDARFKEELSAVSALQAGGLDLTALKLLRELVQRYPEVPTVVTARYLAPSMLLERAEGNGDRLGYTRSSLRHTAAAELAAFLLVHPDAPEAPDAAGLLTDALHALMEPARETALAGLLARRYREGAAAWRLSLADARAHLAGGQTLAASRILAGLEPPADGVGEVNLERGRVAEALGDLAEARRVYGQSGLPEAQARLAWLDRDTLVVPPLLVLTPDDPPKLVAHLRPGAEVAMTAIRVNLEAVLLRDGGALDASNISVEGLRPAASRTFRVDATGNIPLPSLAPGAYLVTVATGASSGRLLVVRTDLDLVVEGAAQGGTLIHAQDARGNPVDGAQLWLFQGGGAAGTARTDGRGAAWVPFGGGNLGVLARIGDRYAWSAPSAQRSPAYGAPASPAPGYDGLLEKNARSYDDLFQQEERQRVRADML